MRSLSSEYLYTLVILVECGSRMTAPVVECSFDFTELLARVVVHRCMVTAWKDRVDLGS